MDDFKHTMRAEFEGYRRSRGLARANWTQWQAAFEAGWNARIPGSEQMTPKELALLDGLLAEAVSAMERSRKPPT
jgi:hypothetical protein